MFYINLAFATRILCEALRSKDVKFKEEVSITLHKLEESGAQLSPFVDKMWEQLTVQILNAQKE